jgi:hypothetical protein
MAAVPEFRAVPAEPCPVNPLGDFRSPFFRVRFFISKSTLRVFKEKENKIRREQKRGLIAFDFERPAAGMAQDFNDTQSLGRDGQQLIDINQIDKYVTSLEISHRSAAISNVTMTLNPPYDVAVAILENRVIRRGSLALVEFGYASPDGDILSGPYLFNITKPSAEFGDEVSITLEGNDMLSHNLLGKSVSYTWSKSDFPTDLSIIEELAFSLELKLHTQLLAKEPPSPLRKKRDDDRQQNRSDWVFFKEIISNSKATWVLCGNTLFLADRLVLLTAPPRYTLRYRHQIISATDIPISTISFDTTSEFFNAAKTKDMSKVSTDKDTGLPNNETVPTTGNLGNVTNAGNQGSNEVVNTPIGGGVIDSKLSKGKTGASNSGPDRDSLHTNRVYALVEEAAVLQAVKGTATIPGVPGIRPQEKVIIEGVPEIYKGEYMIKKVVHKLGDGYTCELTLLRQGQHTPDGKTKKGENPEQTKTRKASTTPTEIK